MFFDFFFFWWKKQHCKATVCGTNPFFVPQSHPWNALSSLVNTTGTALRDGKCGELIYKMMNTKLATDKTVKACRVQTDYLESVSDFINNSK